MQGASGNSGRLVRYMELLWQDIRQIRITGISLPEKRQKSNI